jgi:hypothetical protein
MMVRCKVAIDYFPFFFRDAGRGLAFFLSAFDAALVFLAFLAAGAAVDFAVGRARPAALAAGFVAGRPVAARGRRAGSDSPATGSSDVPSAAASINTTSDQRMW